MKSVQNKMNNSSCSTNKNGSVKNNSINSTTGFIRNQGDLRELKNQGDLRDVTDNGGYKDRNNLTLS
jgi:hypothetical protein